MNEPIEVAIIEKLRNIWNTTYIGFCIVRKIQINSIGLACESNITLQLFGKWKSLRFIDLLISLKVGLLSYLNPTSLCSSAEYFVSRLSWVQF